MGRIEKRVQEAALLLTNDDGIDAPGLQALIEATEGLGERTVVAPAGQFSSCGHTITTHKAMTIEKRGEGRYAVGGAPADCVRLAVHHLAPGSGWVISGVNAGGNLGTDVFPSGTVAAVREGVTRGRPGVAVSHYIAKGKQIDWGVAAQRAGRVIRLLLAMEWEPGTFWNVNLPHIDPGGDEPEVVFCGLDTSPLPLAYRLEDGGRVATYCGDYQSRMRAGGTDVDVCFGGRIAVSRVRVF